MQAVSTDTTEAKGETRLAQLRAALEKAGFTIGQDHMAPAENLCRWHAWRALSAPARDCDLNDRPPSLFVTPSLFRHRDKEFAGAEVRLRGEQRGQTFQVTAYGSSLEEIPTNLAETEAALLRAWNAVSEKPVATPGWTLASERMPEPGTNIVKRWKSGSVWAGLYHGTDKDSSFHEWYQLPA